MNFFLSSYSCCKLFASGKKKCCQDFENYISFSSPMVFYLFCLDLLNFCLTRLGVLLQLRTGHEDLMCLFKRSWKHSSRSSCSHMSWTGCISPSPLGKWKQNPRASLHHKLLHLGGGWVKVWTSLGDLVAGKARKPAHSKRSCVSGTHMQLCG